MRRSPTTSVGRYRLFHVLKLFIHESRSLRRVLKTVRIGVLLLEELLVFRRCVDFRQRIGKFLYDVGWRASAYDDRTKLGQRYLVCELKQCWHILERGKPLLPEQQNRAHLLAIEKLRNVACLL